MDNAGHGITIAVAVFIAAILVSLAIWAVTKGTSVFNGATANLDASLASLNNADKKLYDGTPMSGTDVIDCINKYKDTELYVVVNTRDGSAYIYNGLFDPNLADAATIASDAKEVNVMLWELGGWPANYWGSDSAAHPIETALASGASADSTPRFGSLTVAPKGIYDATSTSGTAGYLSPNASFTSSLQVDANNDVRVITFIQK